jgi:DNA mismatch repair protein MutL
LLAIDINRAKERILYERYLNSMTNARPAIQENLFPQTIDLDHSSYTLLMENPEKLKEIGFDIRPFGTDCIVVYGLPSTLADEQLDIKECIDTLIADLSEIGKDFDGEFKRAIALKMVKAGRRGNNQAPGQAEAQGIIDALFACNEPHRSPSGELCMSIITLEELSGRF